MWGKVLMVLLNKIYEHRKIWKRANINKAWVKHDLETNQNFNFKDSKMLVYINNENAGKLLNLVSYQTTILYIHKLVNCSQGWP